MKLPKWFLQLWPFYLALVCVILFVPVGLMGREMRVMPGWLPWVGFISLMGFQVAFAFGLFYTPSIMLLRRFAAISPLYRILIAVVISLLLLAGSYLLMAHNVPNPLLLSAYLVQVLARWVSGQPLDL
jgi:hypothetical protein